jgi:hypothetical protein
MYIPTHDKGANLGGGGTVGSGFQEINKPPINLNKVACAAINNSTNRHDDSLINWPRGFLNVGKNVVKKKKRLKKPLIY